MKYKVPVTAEITIEVTFEVEAGSERQAAAIAIAKASALNMPSEIVTIHTVDKVKVRLNPDGEGYRWAIEDHSLIESAPCPVCQSTASRISTGLPGVVVSEGDVFPDELRRPVVRRDWLEILNRESLQRCDLCRVYGTDFAAQEAMVEHLGSKAERKGN